MTNKLFLEINSGILPKKQVPAGLVDREGGLGVARHERGDRVTDPRSQGKVSSHHPRKTRYRYLKKGGALAQSFKLS